jgi:type IV secretory pathway VirB10-like protein
LSSTSAVSLNNKEILPFGIRDGLSEYHLSAGTVIVGVLLTGINSDLPGQILGQVSQNVYDSATGKHLLIPQGEKVVGEYDSRVVYRQERVLIVWTRIIFPDASSISLEAMPGVDMSGYAGLCDKVNNHYLKLLTGVVFS